MKFRDISVDQWKELASQDFRDEYECDFEYEPPKWVIPHGSPLDYCSVSIVRTQTSGFVIIKGTRRHGWKPDRAVITTRVHPNKLTDTPSWHPDFLALYDDPHQSPNRMA